MCGIFGYVGPSTSLRTSSRSDAPRVVFDGLRRLEYRGYDSWGIVTGSQKAKVKRQKLTIEKHVGKISSSKSNSKFLNHSSNIALGHTRWATHGGVTRANAHPHFDCTKSIAVVHNGIVENYEELKKSLKGHKFSSETDTEVIVHLIEEKYKTLSPSEALRATFNKLSGLNAIVLILNGEIFAAKSGSPLVVGVAKGGYFIASDASAVLPHTRRVVFIKDGQMARIGKDLSIFEAKSGKKVKAKVERLDWDREEADVGKFRNFMIKEIYEQPKVIRNISKNYSEHIEGFAQHIKAAKGTFFIGAGTAYHACLFGTYLFSKVAKRHVNTSFASEFNYLEDFLNRRSLIVALSQSGETIDVIEPLNRAKSKGSKIVSLVNNLGSTIWQMSDYKVPLSAGVEIAVASTKAYIAMLVILFFTAYSLDGGSSKARRVLDLAASEIDRILSEEIDNVKRIAKVLNKSNQIFIIGRGLSYQTALEAALKIKEVSYVSTEGLAGGELKHGPIALIDKGTPVIVFAPKDETYDAVISNAAEIKARGGVIIGVGSKKETVFDYFVKVRDLGEATAIANVVPAQLFGYFLAVEKGLDPDRPRNLAKSVTVK